MEQYEVLSNIEINKILSKCKIFKGAFAADLVPLKGVANDQAFIINTDENHQPGSHWTALVIKKRRCFFFDPLGTELTNTKLLVELKTMGFSHYKYNAKQVQPDRNNNCGYYCIAFIISMNQNYNLTNFVSMFADDIEKNNNICYDFIAEYI